MLGLKKVGVSHFYFSSGIFFWRAGEVEIQCLKMQQKNNNLFLTGPSISIPDGLKVLLGAEVGPEGSMKMTGLKSSGHSKAHQEL